MLYIDKLLGGRTRDKDETAAGMPTEPAALKAYIQNLIDQSTISFSQITGSPATNTELKTYIQNLIDTINLNDLTTGAQITNDLKAYFSNLLNTLTVTFEQITGAPSVNSTFKTYIDNLVQELTASITDIIQAPILTTEIKNYIESLIDDLTINWSQITGSPIINTELKNYIDNLKQEIVNSFDTFVGGTISAELKIYIDATLTDIFNTLTDITEQTDLNTTLLTDIQNQLIDITALIDYIQSGDEITQEYKDYIDQKFTNIYSILTEITNQSVLNAEFKTEVTNRLTEITNQLTEITQLSQLYETLLTEVNNLKTVINDFKTYIQEGDQVTQELKTYVDEHFTSIDNRITAITEASYITEEIKNYIDDRLTEVKNITEQFITNVVNEDLRKYITEITNVTGEATRLISGSITWLENLDYKVSPLVYQILNQRIESAEIIVTIPANVVNNPVFAIITGDIYGNISHIYGTPAPAPAVPNLTSPSTQIVLLTVYIPALGTTPGADPDGETPAVVTEVIYNEATEWTPAKTEEAGVTIDTAATIEPATGTKHVSMTFAGGAATFEKSDLLISAGTQPGKSFTFDADHQDFSLSVSDIFPDHKTDFSKTFNTEGIETTVRHLVYYRAAKLTDIRATLQSAAGVNYPLCISGATSETLTAAGTGLSVVIPLVLSVFTKSDIVPGGIYKLIVSGFTRYDQQYIAAPAGNVTPAAALVSFTRSEAINAEGGNIALSIKTGAPWLSNSGLLIEIYNGTTKTGSLSILAPQLRGFNPENTNDYQRLILPFSDFNATKAEITALVIRPVNAFANGTALYFDNIVLQTGITTTPSKDNRTNWTQTDETAANYLKNKPTLGSMSVKDFWTGTAAAYAAISVKSSNTIYFVEE